MLKKILLWVWAIVATTAWASAQTTGELLVTTNSVLTWIYANVQALMDNEFWQLIAFVLSFVIIFFVIVQIKKIMWKSD